MVSDAGVPETLQFTQTQPQEQFLTNKTPETRGGLEVLSQTLHLLRKKL